MDFDLFYILNTGSTPILHVGFHNNLNLHFWQGQVRHPEQIPKRLSIRHVLLNVFESDVKGLVCKWSVIGVDAIYFTPACSTGWLEGSGHILESLIDVFIEIVGEIPFSIPSKVFNSHAGLNTILLDQRIQQSRRFGRIESSDSYQLEIDLVQGKCWM